jgi:hypothetical protein
MTQETETEIGGSLFQNMLVKISETLSQKQTKSGQGVAQGTKCLLSKREAFSSNPSTAKKKKDC